MKLPVVKSLVDNYSLEQLQQAEEALMNEEKPAIAIEGDDEGEQLTHVLAAAWIIDYMQTNNVEYKLALREYTKKVRESIS
jgi:hypothetical protein